MSAREFPSVRNRDDQSSRDLERIEDALGRKIGSVPSELVKAISGASTGTVAAMTPIDIFDAEGKPCKQVDILTEIGRQHLLFQDPAGNAYARVKIKGHFEVHAIESKAYREVLAEAFFRLTDKGCNRNSLSDALVTLSSLARFDGQIRPVHVRVAHLGDKIVIDMGRPDWRCIEVDADGWRWCESPPMFRRAGAPLPLPEPKEPDFSRLWKHANVCAEHRPLVAGFMVAALRPVGPYPQLHLSGEHGTGKSTLARVIKSLIDPSASQLRGPPKEVRDLLVGALNGWVVAMDNLSFLNPQLSDALCRLSTGGAISERQLYTNVEEVLIELQRPVILNGIEDLAARPDLADRGLHIELEVIEHYKTELEFWAEFQEDAPYVFGALLRALSLAIRDHKAIDIGKPPRMADFATFAAAGMPALGFTAEIFMNAYRDNIENGLTAAMDSSPVGSALIAMMQTQPVWTGTATELLTALTARLTEGAGRSPAWPKSPRGLSGAVRRLAPSLRSAGVEVNLGRQSKERRITLCKTRKQPLQPSSASGNDDNDANDGEGRVLHKECTPEEYRRGKDGE